MKNFIKKILGLDNNKGEAATQLRKTIITEKKRDLRELKQINKKLRLSMEEGDIEITIKNVKGVLDELK